MTDGVCKMRTRKAAGTSEVRKRFKKAIDASQQISYELGQMPITTVLELEACECGDAADMVLKLADMRSWHPSSAGFRTIGNFSIVSSV